MAKKKMQVNDRLLQEYFYASLKDDLDSGIINMVTYRLKMNSSESFNEFRKMFLTNPVKNEKYYREIYEKRMDEIVIVDNKEITIEDEVDFDNIEVDPKKKNSRRKKEKDDSIDSIDDFLSDF